MSLIELMHGKHNHRSTQKVKDNVLKFLSLTRNIFYHYYVMVSREAKTPPPSSFSTCKKELKYETKKNIVDNMFTTEHHE